MTVAMAAPAIAHMENEDKKRIEKVFRTAPITTVAIPRPENPWAIRKLFMPPEINAKKVPAGINCDIGIGVGKGCFTGSEPHKQRIFAEQKQTGEDCGQDQQHQEAVI